MKKEAKKLLNRIEWNQKNATSGYVFLAKNHEVEVVKTALEELIRKEEADELVE